MYKIRQTKEQLAYEAKELKIFCVILAVYLAACAAVYIGTDMIQRTRFVTRTPIAMTSETDEIPESARININTASKEELMTIKGIGTVTADRIIEYREKNNGFIDVDELIEVQGIGEKTLENMRPYLTA